jgi:hypothetical protein
MKIFGFHIFLCLSSLLFTSCYYDNAEDLYQNFQTDCDTTVISFSEDVMPIINQNCISCHGTVAPSAGLMLTNHTQIADAVANRDLLGRVLLPPGNPSRMPPSGMSDCNIDKIKAWVNANTPNN